MRFSQFLFTRHFWTTSAPLPARSKQEWQCTQSQGEAPAAVTTERVQVRRERGRDMRRARQWAKGHASVAAETAHEGNGPDYPVRPFGTRAGKGGPRETLGARWHKRAAAAVRATK